MAGLQEIDSGEFSPRTAADCPGDGLSRIQGPEPVSILETRRIVGNIGRTVLAESIYFPLKNAVSP
jgi:hypothetical protein